MRFVARTPREGINVSGEHPAVDAFMLTGGLAVTLILVFGFLVSFINIVVLLVSPETEMKIFSEWDFSEFLPIEFDTPQARELQSLSDRLTRHWPDSRYQFRLGVLKDRQANAFALPGGIIAISSGLLEDIETENELAFILAHELGHFENRDHLRMLGRGVALGLILMVISGSDGGLVSGEILSLSAHSFNRDQETAADASALALVYEEYRHTAGALGFFERLENSDASSMQILQYLSSHPATGDRIEQLERLANERGWSTRGTTVPINL